jgi:hypothetical protein
VRQVARITQKWSHLAVAVGILFCSDAETHLALNKMATAASGSDGAAGAASLLLEEEKCPQRRAIVLLPVRESASKAGIEVLLGQREVENILGGGNSELVPFAGELLGVGGRLHRGSNETPLEVALRELAACGFAVSHRTRLHNVNRFDRLAVASIISGTRYDVQVCGALRPSGQFMLCASPLRNSGASWLTTS